MRILLSVMSYLLLQANDHFYPLCDSNVDFAFCLTTELSHTNSK